MAKPAIHGELLPMRDAEVVLYRDFFGQAEADAFFTRLTAEVNWQPQEVKIFGKFVPVPRLVSWYGDPGTDYSYTGITVHPQPWIAPLTEIKARLDTCAGVTFNSVLCNLYRDGKDSIGWHSDDEYKLGTNPVVGSVSFGAPRVFHFRHKQDKSLRTKVELSHGSFLLMRGPTQHCWSHQLPKTAKQVSPRINLTYRVIHT
jgi:alkylated DNA repair dioxygenase AlkB